LTSRIGGKFDLVNGDEEHRSGEAGRFEPEEGFQTDLDFVMK